MTNTPELAAVVFGFRLLVLAAVVAGLWFIGWRRYRLDLFRERLFALRHELFDYAMAGHIAFNDPEYGGLRHIINTMIRFGHRLTFLRLITVSAFGPEIPEGMESSYDRWKEAVARVDNGDVKTQLMQIHDRFLYQMAEQIVATSPLLLVTLGLVLCISPLVVGAQRVTSFVARIARGLHGLTLLEQEADALEMELVA